MDDDTPIDIQYGKVGDWLIKRRLCKQNWSEPVIAIRKAINSAIQDMPVHEEIAKLLAGSYINYFHCLKIVEILKETEADTKNIFGRYSSKRMQDWQSVVKQYEVDCLFLAEGSQLLARNVNYEIPGLKKQVAKCKKVMQECLRKEAEYKSQAVEFKMKYAETCKNIGIQGNNVRSELLSLAADLPVVLDKLGEKSKALSDSLTYYRDFVLYTNQKVSGELCPMLSKVIEHGNITTYQWRTGKPPKSVIQLHQGPEATAENNKEEGSGEPTINFGGDEIDFGGDEIDFGGDDIDFGVETIDENKSTANLIENTEDIKIELNETGISELTLDLDSNASCAAHDDGVARGKDALSVLENPTTRFQFVDELEELKDFFSQRIQDSSNSSDVIVMSLIQSAPASLQLSDSELSAMLSLVDKVHAEMTTSKMQQLLSIRNSPRYVERMTETITKILDQSEKMSASARLMMIKYREVEDELILTEPKIDAVKQKTFELKAQLEIEIGRKCKGRTINIMGDINTL